MYIFVIHEVKCLDHCPLDVCHYYSNENNTFWLWASGYEGWRRWRTISRLRGQWVEPRHGQPVPTQYHHLSVSDRIFNVLFIKTSFKVFIFEASEASSGELLGIHYSLDDRFIKIKTAYRSRILGHPVLFWQHNRPLQVNLNFLK